MSATVNAPSTVRSPCGIDTVMYLPDGDSETLVNSGSLKKSPTGTSCAETANGAASTRQSDSRLRNGIIGSSRGSGSGHHGNEAVEQRGDVLRAGAGLRMSLETEGRGIGEFDALVGTVEQRAVRDAHVRGKRGLVDREAVVLARDHH